MSSLQLDPLPAEINQPMYRAICGAFVAQYEIYKKLEFTADEIVAVIDYDNRKSVQAACSALVRHDILTVTDEFKTPNGGQPSKRYAMVALLNHKDSESENTEPVSKKNPVPIAPVIEASVAIGNDKLFVAQAAKNVGLTQEEGEKISKLPDRISLQKIGAEDLALRDHDGKIMGAINKKTAIEMCQFPNSMVSAWNMDAGTDAVNTWMRAVESTLINAFLRLRTLAEKENGASKDDEFILHIAEAVEGLTKKVAGLFDITGQPKYEKLVKHLFDTTYEKEMEIREKAAVDSIKRGEDVIKAVDEIRGQVEQRIKNIEELVAAMGVDAVKSHFNIATNSSGGFTFQQVQEQYQQGFKDGIKFMAGGVAVDVKSLIR